MYLSSTLPPESTTGPRQSLAEDYPLLRRNWTTRSPSPIAPGDCTRIARDAAKSGQPVRLYACGGDGTLNEVVNGAASHPNAAVTHYAGGSGNDFVTYLF